MPRPTETNLSMQLGRWHSHTIDKAKDFGGRIQFQPFYQHSENGKALAKYFMYDNKTEMKFTGVAADAPVHPYNFNLAGGYTGSFSFNPKQEVYGVRLDYFQHLYRLLNGLYFSVSSPIMHMQNDPGLKETVTATGKDATDDGPQNFTESFAGHVPTSDWSDSLKYSKIAGKQTLSGMGDIDVRLGYTILEKQPFKLAVTVGGIVPTSNKPTAEYMFEPVLGNGQSWGLGAGFETLFKAWQSDDNERRYLHISASLDYRYLFENEYMRTLELKNQKWGRFIRMRQLDTVNTTAAYARPGSFFGPNVMTRKVKVTPGSQFDGVASLCFRLNNNWHFDLGYNIWGREAESVKLKEAWASKGTYGLIAKTTYNPSAPATGDTYVGPGWVASNETEIALYKNKANKAGNTANGFLSKDIYISRMLPGIPWATAVSSTTTSQIYAPAASTDGKALAESDLDLSGHPVSISHKIFGGVDYTFKKIQGKKYPVVLGLHGSYEFAQDNAALDQWAVWLKLGTTF